jgi:pantoate--beta-alanine ligase/2-amino-4-hydroxy-6-hydroxymethyldihydropteridine diphosphokinase
VSAGRGRAFVALGSNLGDRRAHLEGALAALARDGEVRLAAVSRAYENPPVAGPASAPAPRSAGGDYWNAVAEVSTSLDPPALLALLRRIEDDAGRRRSGPDAPRILDLDLLTQGDAVVATSDVERGSSELVLPHPRALDRAFVLAPWREIAPDAVVPKTRRTVLQHEAALLARSPEAFDALRPVALLSPAPARRARPPVVLRDRRALAAFRDAAEGTVGFTPTLGALHAGHAANARRARAECDVVVASVFVNPLQFGPGEDFERYPRALEADVALLSGVGVDAVYAPTAADMYPEGFSTSVDVGPPAEGLEGTRRPGHFRGVATVVAKLLARVRPHRAYFGRKDAQQNAVLRRLVADLDLPGELVVCPTVRDADGLALSSRNRYLSPDERARALAIPRALEAARRRAASGESDAVALAREAFEALRAAGLEPDYAEVRDPATFRPVGRLEAPALLVVAARAGSTRLLDNEWLVPKDVGR